MFLRHVFLLRRHELASEHTGVTAQLQDQHASSFGSAARVTELASKLKQNAAAAHQNMHRFAWATYFGVRLCTAIWNVSSMLTNTVVHGITKANDPKQYLQLFASHCSKPPMEKEHVWLIMPMQDTCSYT